MSLTACHSNSPSRPLSHLRRLGWQVLGFVALGLGALGVVLPLLPTTPLVILATFAFAKSSPALHAWLIRNKIFGPIIADWQSNGVIAPRYKILALSMMLGALLLSVLLAMSALVLGIQLICMGLAACFILTRPSRAK
ncbi:YbaN family protein [Marivita sp. S0852]|uniref:YbaN family protein n=1 Tax=Marivita sp. S0852 TaxID=3373893 RepID=UPI003982712B